MKLKGSVGTETKGCKPGVDTVRLESKRKFLSIKGSFWSSFPKRGMGMKNIPKPNRS